MIRRIALFTALILPVFMIGIDLLVIGVAIAPMAKTFQVPMHTVQWFVTAYAVGYAAFVGASGRLSEIIGKKVFLIILEKKIYTNGINIKRRFENIIRRIWS